MPAAISTCSKYWEIIFTILTYKFSASQWKLFTITGHHHWFGSRSFMLLKINHNPLINNKNRNWTNFTCNIKYDLSIATIPYVQQYPILQDFQIGINDSRADGGLGRLRRHFIKNTFIPKPFIYDVLSYLWLHFIARYGRCIIEFPYRTVISRLKKFAK